MKTIYALLIAAVIAGLTIEKPASAAVEPSIHLLIKRGKIPSVVLSRSEKRDQIARIYGIDPLEFRAMERIESGGNNAATRFEPGEMNRARRLAPKAGIAELRYLATSHCSMQVMGWWEVVLQLPRGSLKDQETCYEVAARIRADCENRRPGKGAACYNGSEKYAVLVKSEMRKLAIKG